MKIEEMLYNIEIMSKMTKNFIISSMYTELSEKEKEEVITSYKKEVNELINNYSTIENKLNFKHEL